MRSNYRCYCNKKLFKRKKYQAPAARIHIVENTALNVLKTAQAKGELKGLNALNYLADEMGIVCDDIYEKGRKSCA